MNRPIRTKELHTDNRQEYARGFLRRADEYVREMVRAGTLSDGEFGGSAISIMAGFAWREVTAALATAEKDKKYRSSPQHRRFFKVVTRAFEQWPENHDWNPIDENHLRKLLLIQAGYFEARDAEIPWPENKDDMARYAIAFGAAYDELKRWAGQYGEIRHNKNYTKLRAYRAKSMNFKTMDHRTACKVMSDVEALIEQVMGCTTDQLLKEEAA